MSIFTSKIPYDEKICVGNKNDIPKIKIIYDDMFIVAKSLYISGNKVCLHNFANNFRPGLYKKSTTGKIYFQTHTQEEQLLRATIKNNQLILDDKFYPICSENENNALYSRNVLFCKDTKKGYRINKSEYYIADVITCPAIKNPKTANDSIYLNEKEKLDTLNRLILTIYLAKDCDVLVTGLWGCGNFCNPLEGIFNLWNEAISKVSASPKEIIFVFPSGFDARKIYTILEKK